MPTTEAVDDVDGELARVYSFPGRYADSQYIVEMVEQDDYEQEQRIINEGKEKSRVADGSYGS